MHVHSILLKLNFRSCPHEPFLHAGRYEEQPLVFLRQVDDFAVASKSPELANSFLDDLDSNLR